MNLHINLVFNLFHFIIQLRYGYPLKASITIDLLLFRCSYKITVEHNINCGDKIKSKNLIAKVGICAQEHAPALPDL